MLTSLLFANFSLDEMANFDLPAAIDMVLQLNGANSLYYVGHSQVFIVSGLK